MEYCTSLGLDDTNVGSACLRDWYCLLRRLQGNFNMYQKMIDNSNKIYMINSIDFIMDSLFCEYAYIINLDDNMLEFYTGFQHVPQEGNRYGTESTYEGHDGTKYYPCKLLKTFSLNEIDDVDVIVGVMNMITENEYED